MRGGAARGGCQCHRCRRSPPRLPQDARHGRGEAEALHEELTQARAAYARLAGAQAEAGGRQQTALTAPQEEADLSPMLKAALDKLWQRPYDCRVFTLQLLQGLAQLDNSSLCMMTSCFARYLENHSVPA